MSGDTCEGRLVPEVAAGGPGSLTPTASLSLPTLPPAIDRGTGTVVVSASELPVSEMVRLGTTHSPHQRGEAPGAIRSPLDG